MADTGREKSIPLAITVSSGSGSGTITNSWDRTYWFRVVPPSESDTYNVTVKDGNGYIILSRTGQLGTLSEQIGFSLGIAKTIDIASASSDGTYRAIFDLHG